MRIAVIGAGISGLVSAYLLSRSHDVTVFEAGARAGGHTNTIDVSLGGTIHHVDTGFIVFNRPNYPLFVRLLEELDVAVQPTDMSFSVQSEADDLEWCGSGLGAFFAQRRNLLRRAHWRLLREILRFNRSAPALLTEEEGAFTLREYLAREGYSPALSDLYIVPMAAALWSADPGTVLDFPAHYFVRFFENHGFFKVKGRPDWLAIRGGSQRYVEKLIAGFRDRIRTRTPVQSVRRDDEGVEIETEAHGRERFDAVVISTHSDQALRMLADPSPAESDVLGAIPYQPNEAILHTDERVMPRARAAWSSWNYHVPAEATATATVTYWMNRLQTLPADPPFFVTLNRTTDIAPERILRRIGYHHPVYTPATRAAQLRWEEINGVRHTWYAGAYWGWGFHEDGVRSAVRVTERFGETLA
ncbi:MAG: FAD-dependent oxidoreductase [Planctomycetota bacterium]|nr:FAD-dependent oxidoreductase [Planctomycetota bacterium]